MLESINFLVSCGDCFVIMGLARRRVERCVGLVFEKVAAETPDIVDGRVLTDADKRRRFARQYLEKLINIEVPVPRGEPGQIQTLLVNKPTIPAEPPTLVERLATRMAAWLPHILPVALCAIVATAAILASDYYFRPEVAKTPDEAPADIRAKAEAAIRALEGPTPGSQAAATPQIGSARFQSGERGGAPIGVVLLAAAVIVVPGIIRLSRRSGSVVEDSPAFVNALEKWFPFLASGAEMTPRTVKRFVNRVRYFAMMEGSFQPAARWWSRLARFFAQQPETPPRPPTGRTNEDILVALATMHERHPDWFAGSFAQFRETSAEAGDAYDLHRIDEPTYNHFRKLVAGVEVR
jgi:hypothetical protein